MGAYLPVQERTADVRTRRLSKVLQTENAAVSDLVNTVGRTGYRCSPRDPKSSASPETSSPQNSGAAFQRSL